MQQREIILFRMIACPQCLETLEVKRDEKVSHNVNCNTTLMTHWNTTHQDLDYNGIRPRKVLACEWATVDRPPWFGVFPEGWPLRVAGLCVKTHSTNQGSYHTQWALAKPTKRKSPAVKASP